MTFFLGAPHATFLRRTSIPLFVSRRTLQKIKRRFPRALGPWALDSGAFTEIDRHGTWLLTPRDYVALVRLFIAEIGMMAWAAIQDWMCEPHMLERTGKSIVEHQARTIRSFVELRDLAPDVPWTPVIQGWTIDDYMRCVDGYASCGVDLRGFDTVGVGSVCRRQNTDEVEQILRAICGLGIRAHGFGVKSRGLERVADVLRSADSMAWSKRAWKIGTPAMPECIGGPHKNCANCLRFALHWRERLLAKLPERWALP